MKNLTGVILGFLLLITVASAINELSFIRSEIGWNSACTYYSVSNPTASAVDSTKLAASDRLHIDGFTQLKGTLKSSHWEELVSVPYGTTTWQSNISCVNVQSANGTWFDNCTDKGKYVSQTLYNDEWKPLDPAKLSVEPLKTKQVRFCGNYQMAKTKDGWSISIDHIPSYLGKTYDGTKGVPAYAWWNASWQYSSCYQATASMINGTLYNYTTLFNRTNAAFASGTYNSLRFVSYDNSTELPYEIVNFNSSVGFIEAYMMFPVFDASSANTSAFCLYYGNTGVASTQNSNNTWDKNFTIVYHFNETSGTIYSSVSPMYNGTPQNLTKQGAWNLSMVNGALDLSNTTDNIIIADLDSSYITVEAYVKPNNYAGYRGVVCKWWDGITRSWCLYTLDTGGANYAWDVATAASDTDHFIKYFLPAGDSYTYHYVAGVYDGTNQLVYWNKNVNSSALAGSTVRNNAAYITIGSEPRDSTGKTFINNINDFTDEVRISNIARNSSYINTTYDNLMNNTNFWTKLSDYTYLDFTWNYQFPVDLTSTNLFANDSKLNVSYNITGVASVSTVYLAYKTNTSSADCIIYTNGTLTPCGWQYSYAGTNVSTTWNWSISSENVLPSSYNYNQSYMEYANKSNTTLSNANQQVRIGLLNISNSTQYGWFEVYANQTSATGSNLRVLYCNLSYTSGNPLASSNCVQFGTILANATYNHTHSANSSHMLLPFAVNTTNGRIGTVQITSNSSFILIPTSSSGAWNVRYIANITRPGAGQTSANGGVTWSSLSGTYDSHIHQFNNDTVLYYYASADGSNSSISNDTIALVNLAPTAPAVLTPLNGSSYRAENETVNVSWVQSLSPNGSAILYYNVSLLNADLSLNRTLNDTINSSTSIIWNASGLFPSGTHTFTIRITAFNAYGSAEAEMDGTFFLVSNTPPAITVPVITPVSPLFNQDLTCSATISDANSDDIQFTVTWWKNGVWDSATALTPPIAVPVPVAAILTNPFAAGDNYSCTINASDFSNTTMSAWATNVTILNYTYPTVFLSAPADVSNVPTSGVTFSWLCNNSETATLTADVVLNGTLISSQTCGNGTACSYTYATPQLCSTFTWNVTCNDTAGRSGNSSTWSYTKMPTLTLLPASGGVYANGTNFTFSLASTCYPLLINLSLNDSFAFNCSSSLLCSYTNGTYLSNGTYNYTGWAQTFAGVWFSEGPYYFNITDPTVYASAGVVFNFTRNYTLTEFQNYITTFMSDWIGYIFGIFIMAIAFLMSRKLSTMFITGGVGMLAAYFMVSNPVFLSASILLMLIGLVMKYLAG